MGKYFPTKNFFKACATLILTISFCGSIFIYQDIEKNETQSIVINVKKEMVTLPFALTTGKEKNTFQKQVYSQYIIKEYLKETIFFEDGELNQATTNLPPK